MLPHVLAVEHVEVPPLVVDALEAAAGHRLAQELTVGVLRGVLGRGGFRGIDNEWWHFEMGDRQQVRQHFTRVE